VNFCEDASVEELGRQIFGNRHGRFGVFSSLLPSDANPSASLLRRDFATVFLKIAAGVFSG
jgi:hypothetical protein